MTESQKKFVSTLKNMFFIRLHMFFILAGTFFSGFICSILLRYTGLDSIIARYLISITISYLTFICLIKVWLMYIFGLKIDADESTVDIDTIPSFSFRNLSEKHFSGGGGDSSGGGASTSWGDDDKSLFSKADFSSLDDDAAPVVIAIVVIGIVLIAAGFGIYFIIDAPSILSEIALEMAISLGLFNKISRNKGDWFLETIKKTIGFFISFLVLTFIYLKIMTSLYPEIRTSRHLIIATKQEIAKIIKN